jgi:hypothetical protein
VAVRARRALGETGTGEAGTDKRYWVLACWNSDFGWVNACFFFPGLALGKRLKENGQDLASDRRPEA